MATDATGAPTSLGIPKYNTSVDAPSGLGFNAAMDAINTLIAARIANTLTTTTGDIIYASAANTPARLAIGSTGQVLGVSGGIPSWGAKTTVSTWAGGPPGSPADKDIWIATDVDGFGCRWQFQYNAGSGSAYKWEFLGGGEVAKIGNANAVLNAMTQVAASNFWADAALQSYTVTRAGDWSIRGMFDITANGGVQSPIASGVFGGGATIGAGGMGAIRMTNPLATAVSTDSTVTIEETVFAQGANAVIGIAGNSGVVGTHKMQFTSMRIRPVRIS